MTPIVTTTDPSNHIRYDPPPMLDLQAHCKSSQLVTKKGEPQSRTQYTTVTVTSANTIQRRLRSKYTVEVVRQQMYSRIVAVVFVREEDGHKVEEHFETSIDSLVKGRIPVFDVNVARESVCDLPVDDAEEW